MFLAAGEIDQRLGQAWSAAFRRPRAPIRMMFLQRLRVEPELGGLAPGRWIGCDLASELDQLRRGSVRRFEAALEEEDVLAMHRSAAHGPVEVFGHEPFYVDDDDGASRVSAQRPPDSSIRAAAPAPSRSLNVSSSSTAPHPSSVPTSVSTRIRSLAPAPTTWTP